MARFEVWRDDDDGDYARVDQVDAADAEEAAEIVTERRFADWDYPRLVELRVRELRLPAPAAVLVEVEVASVPVFTGRRCKGGAP